MKVLVQSWLESEEGWGYRPDGVSIHFSEESRKQYIDAYWSAMQVKYGNETPHEYSRPEGSPIEMVFDAEHADEAVLAKALKESDWREWKNSPKYLKKAEA